MKPRFNLYFDEELAGQLDALAAKPGASKSAIVADALRQFLNGAAPMRSTRRSRSVSTACRAKAR